MGLVSQWQFWLVPVIGVVVYLVANEIWRRRARVNHFQGPFNVPIVGNLWQLRGQHPAEQYRRWSKQYGDVFQIQLGNRPILIINSARAAKQLLQVQGHDFISRPVFYTFHKIVSGSAGFSIGTSPWDESCKQRRKAAASALNRPKVSSYVWLFDQETKDFIKSIYHTAIKEPNNILHCIERVSLNMVLTVNYGTRFTDRDSDMINEIMNVETAISALRNTNRNLENYIPFLRLLPNGKQNDIARQVGERRTQYVNKLLYELMERVKNKTDIACIQGNIIKDPQARLSPLEMTSISFSMMAGVETVTPTVYWLILHLSQHPDLQERAYRSIVEHNGGNEEHWEDAADYGNDYIKAIVNEVSRYYSVLRISLPRATYRDCVYEDKFIPAGTTVFLNTWSCNHDPELYAHADKFDIGRWLENDTRGKYDDHDYDKATNTIDGKIAIGHFSFGLGPRMCPASLLATRMLYTIATRLIWSFKIGSAVRLDGKPIDLNPLTGLQDISGMSAAAAPYKVLFEPRNIKYLENQLEI